MQDPKETFNNIEQNTEMALLQSEKIAESVDNLEPIMEGVLVKADDILNEQKKTNELLSKEEEPKPEVQKIELLGAELITIKGKDGENGDKGEKGDKGDTGERGEKGEQGERGDIGKQGEKGEKGDNGDTGKDGIDGLDGKDGKNGKNGKDGSPDTPKQVKEKLLKVGLDYNEIDNTPDINKVINIAVAGVKQSSKTVSLVELDDIDYSGLSIVDGKYVLGGGTGGATWGSITGNIVDQADLQNALNAKQDTITTGTTAQYFRGDLSLATFPTLVSSFTNDAGYITSSALSGYVPNTRTLTINGTAYDLSADRSWTISTGLSALSAIGSAPNANGATITGSTLNLEPADVSFGGVVTTSAQTFSGRKTFNGYITIAGGTASANTAPLKLISGTNLTTAEAGAFEYNGTSLFFTRSGTLRADILMTDIATPFNTYSASLKGATAFTTGNNNILLGNSAGSAMTTGVDNILIGRSTSTGTGGSRNIAIGTATTAGGNYNVSIGAGAGTSSINATNAVSIGNGANYYSFNPNNGIAIGAGAESGLGDNVSIGALAVSAYQGTNNVTVGSNAGRYAASGAGNTLIGNRTGTSLTTGAYNVALGFQSGNAITTGSKNIAIGYDVDPQSNTANGQLTIQNAIFGTDNIGVGTTVSTGNIGIYVVSPLARLHLPAGTATANTAPLKLTTGTNLTTAEAGAMEFTTDNLYFTITTGAARKNVTLDEGLTSGRVPFATTNGRLIDDADMTFATDTLTVTKLVGATSVKVGTAAGYISSDGSTGATGTFTTADLKTVTVKDGIITSIV